MMQRSLKIAAIGTLALALAACSLEGENDSGGESDYPTKPMTIYSYVNPGGGPDFAIRGMIDALEKSGLSTVRLRLDNLPGGSGLVAMSTLANDFTGADDVLMIGTAAPLSATITSPNDVGLDKMTPIALVFSEYTYVYVKADSPFQTIGDLGDALAADPSSVAVGGGSLGSADNIVAAQFARSVGLEPSEMTYVPLSGDEQASSLLGGVVDVTFGGPDQLNLVESGDARVLAVSAEKSIAGVPTFADGGYEGVTQSNWRGIFGPPEMPEAAANYWSELLVEMTGTDEWKSIAEENLWDTTALGRDDFQKFLDEQRAQMETILNDLGLIQ
jgi:putative tricarboxylic transport membrane protein